MPPRRPAGTPTASRATLAASATPATSAAAKGTPGPATAGDCRWAARGSRGLAGAGAEGRVVGATDLTAEVGLAPVRVANAHGLREVLTLQAAERLPGESQLLRHRPLHDGLPL